MSASAGALRKVPHSRRVHWRRLVIGSSSARQQLVISSSSAHQGDHHRDGPIPLVLLDVEPAASGGGDLVITSLALVAGHTPLAADEAALLQAHQPWIEGAHIELHAAVRHLLDARR